MLETLPAYTESLSRCGPPVHWGESVIRLHMSFSRRLDPTAACLRFAHLVRAHLAIAEWSHYALSGSAEPELGDEEGPTRRPIAGLPDAGAENALGKTLRGLYLHASRGLDQEAIVLGSWADADCGFWRHVTPEHEVLNVDLKLPDVWCRLEWAGPSLFVDRLIALVRDLDAHFDLRDVRITAGPRRGRASNPLAAFVSRWTTGHPAPDPLALCLIDEWGLLVPPAIIARLDPDRGLGEILRQQSPDRVRRFLD